ncbi:MAG TPA: DUF4383 domain-containing protein [Actinomycetota bacterium]|nr:DUF4383 domain-containing protein [Actinomycetota bacterium]
MPRAVSKRTPAQSFALIFGVAYLTVGILGFVLAPDAGDELFGIFQVNLLHNVVHLLIGGALLFASSSHLRAKQTNLIVGIVYGVVAALGLANVVVPDLLEANTADDFLHFASAVLGVYFGTTGAQGPTPATV